MSLEVDRSRDTEGLLAEVLKLPATERAELAEKLFESLEDSTDAAWTEEISRCAAAARTQRGLSMDEFDELVRRLRS